MSKLLKKLTDIKIISLILGVVLAAAVAIGVLGEVIGFGVFNQDSLLKDTQTLTVSINQYVYITDEKLDKVETECKKVLDEYGIVYEMKGKMSGDVSEIVYVFGKDAELAGAKTSLESALAALTGENGALSGSTVLVALNSEDAVAVLANHYVLRGVIAGAVLVVLVFAYVAIRYGLYMGIVGGASTLVGTLLTVALIILTRIPVTASVIYVIAVGAILSAVMSVIALNKIRAEKEVIPACNEILTLAALLGVGIVVIGAVATMGVRWFALLSLLALFAATVVSLLFVPALYAPFKVVLDNKPVEGAYVGAEKTSTKVKKVYEKKEVKAAPVEEVAEAPVEETPVEETPVEEVEETPAENPVEETAEAPVEETPVEEVAEAPVEEAPVEEEKQD